MDQRGARAGLPAAMKPQPHFGDEVGFGEHCVPPGYVVAGVGQAPPLLVASLDQVRLEGVEQRIRV